jgi:putative FmdB family regulatory protein
VPLYEFACGRCGPFELWRALADAAAPAACPACGSSGRRVYSAPGIVRTPAAMRLALGREERSAHEPEVVGAPAGPPMPGAHRHGPAPPWAMGH